MQAAEKLCDPPAERALTAIRAIGSVFLRPFAPLQTTNRTPLI